MRCQLEELDQPVVGRLDVLVARIGSEPEPTEQLLPELGRVCATPHGYRLTTHILPVLITRPDVTVALWLSHLVSI